MNRYNLDGSFIPESEQNQTLYCIDCLRRLKPVDADNRGRCNMCKCFEFTGHTPSNLPTAEGRCVDCGAYTNLLDLC